MQSAYITYTPRGVFFLQQLPLAGTNEIDKERLREWVAKDSFNGEIP